MALMTVCHRHQVLVPAGETCPQCAAFRAARGAHDNARLAVKHKEQGLSSVHWARVRRERLRLAGGQCEVRFRGCTGKATTVHLDPVLAGDHRLATVANTLAACRRCHGRLDGGRSRRRRAA